MGKYEVRLIRLIIETLQFIAISMLQTQYHVIPLESMESVLGQMESVRNVTAMETYVSCAGLFRITLEWVVISHSFIAKN